MVQLSNPHLVFLFCPCGDIDHARWYCAQMNDFFNCPKMGLEFSLTRHIKGLINEKIRKKIVLASEILTYDYSYLTFYV